MASLAVLSGLIASLRIGPAVSCAAEVPARPKAPFKVLFSNDTTNITSCTSPYHHSRQGITDDMIRATVDEAAAADAHMLQPGMGWVPWWKSKVYPGDGHYRFYRDVMHVAPDLVKRHDYGRYMLAGGDVVKTFVDQCRKRGVAPLVSLRLNDGHGLEGAGEANWLAMHTVSRFYLEHPEYRIGTNKNDWNQRVLNWAVPAVRDHKFSFIQEICENYDLDGFELDFMRHTSYFRLKETTSQQRAEIMTAFVRRVREVLDRTARPGQRRWLCARVPARLADHDRLGIDLKAMVAAGLDMVNLSASYFTAQTGDVGPVRRLVPGAAVYLEMCHCTMTGRAVGKGGYDNFVFRRTTDQQFYTTAHLAYRRGADGMSLFNFVYYREHGTPGRGPFNEPPFHVLRRLGEPDFLAKQPQWYFLANNWFLALPGDFKPGQSRTYCLDMAPTEHQRRDALVRMATAQDSNKCRWTVKFNGEELRPAEFVLKPIEHPYVAGLGEPSQYASFRCPRSAVKDGPNQLEITLVEGKPVRIEYLDIVLP